MRRENTPERREERGEKRDGRRDTHDSTSNVAFGLLLRRRDRDCSGPHFFRLGAFLEASRELPLGHGGGFGAHAPVRLSVRSRLEAVSG